MDKFFKKKFFFLYLLKKFFLMKWGFSSVARALDWQSRGVGLGPIFSTTILLRKTLVWSKFTN
ncbi:MAG: hypothetical protein CM15mP22_0430 [Gammaproteobacteria bacterium]|nr:MAG: hypothetical protein CM15mP22_0430 [Gammaproteobacteria bacterium]